MENVIELYKAGKQAWEISRKLRITKENVYTILSDSKVELRINSRSSGYVPWNKGLNKSDSRVASYSKSISKSIKEVYSDPVRGKKARDKFANWVKTPEFKQAHIKKGQTRRANILAGKIDVTYGIGSGMKCYINTRRNGKLYMRSSFELILAIYFEFKKVNYEYERLRLFNKQTGKIYVPDFHIYPWDYVLEVKGYSDPELDSKLSTLKEKGYKPKLITWKSIELIKKFLKRRNINVEYYLQELEKRKKNTTFDLTNLVEIV